MMLNICVSIISIITSQAPTHIHSMGLSNRVVCLSMYKILKQLKYEVIHSEKGTITTFELFFEGHSAYSVIYNLWELHTISGSYKSSNFLFLIIARLLRSSSI